jgi:hypothetical protein
VTRGRRARRLSRVERGALLCATLAVGAPGSEAAVASAAARQRFAVPHLSRTNPDDRLPTDPLGRVEGSDRIVEGRHLTDTRPQSPLRHLPGDLTQLRTIGHDNEVDHQAVGRPYLRRADDAHECSSGSDETRGPLADVAAEDIEHQIDPADIFQRIVPEVDELLRVEVERRLTVGRASGTDDLCTRRACELCRHGAGVRRLHGPQRSGRSLREPVRTSGSPTHRQESLPRGIDRHHQGDRHRHIAVVHRRNYRRRGR